MKKRCFLVAVLSLGAFIYASDPVLSGLDSYAKSDWPSAISQFSKAVSMDPGNPEARYWLIMSELSAGQSKAAIADMDRFIHAFPTDPRLPEVMYQKGRAYYNAQSYEDSIKTLYLFITTWPGHAMIPSAYYWVGESLFSTGRYEEAKSVFAKILDSWPEAVKREAAWYRLAQLKQTSKEEELLRLLKMSHEESLKIIEDYQRREKTYEQAIIAYQKRISDMIKDSRLGELERALGEEKIRNSRLLDRISELEIQNAELVAALAMAGKPIPASSASKDIVSDDPEARRLALEELRTKAQSLRELYDQILEEGK